jgi:peptidoglycan/LPS O-acetylase OafA/YrhL
MEAGRTLAAERRQHHRARLLLTLRATDGRRRGDRPMRTKEPVVPRGRLPYFDSARALAASLVFLIHAQGRSHSNVGWLTQLIPGTRGSVQVFFVLSAFLLYQPWVGAHRGRRNKPSVREFATGRVLRIFPAYWVALIGATLIHQTLMKNPTDWIAQLTLTQVYSKTEPFKGIVVNWTLSVEVVFYLLLPIYAALVFAAARRVNVFRAEVGGIVALVVIGVVYQEWCTHTGNWLAQYWAPFYFPSFAAGIALAVALDHVRHEPGPHRIAAWIARTPYLWLAIAALCFWRGAVVGARFDDFLPNGTVQDQALFTIMAAFLIMPGVFPPEKLSVWHRFMHARVLVFIGVVSYGFYLWHVPILDELHDHVLHWKHGAGNFWTLSIVAYLLSLAIGAASWYVVERPALRLRHRVRRRSPSVARA